MRPSDRGFTLIEALIAFAIAALALGVLFQAASSALTETARAAHLEGAVERARSHLAEAGALIGGAGERVETGDDGALYHYRIEITPGRHAFARRGGDGPDPPLRNRVALYRVTVEERWSEASRDRVFRLTSERLYVGPPGAA
jgi:general secretion pathway protein I